MKRVVILYIIGIVVALITVSCSQKYEPPVGPTTDTLTVHDTLFDTILVPGDTVYVDTGHVDTVVIIRPGETDTITVTDTVFVPVDTNGTSSFCGTIEGAAKTLTWLVSKEPSTYRLTFQASVEKGQPPQSVTVAVDGTTTEWPVATQPTLILIKPLSQSTIVITSNVPPAYGHGITICLTIEKH
jgi:hypothetical protein